MRGEDGEAGLAEEREGGQLVEEEEGVGIGGEAGLDGLQVEEPGRRRGGGEEGGEGEAGGDQSLADGGVGGPDEEGRVGEWDPEGRGGGGGGGGPVVAEEEEEGELVAVAVAGQVRRAHGGRRREGERGSGVWRVSRWRG